MAYVVRPAALADAEPIARVHVDTWRSSYTGIVPAACMEAQTFERRAQFWRQVLPKTGSWTLVAAAGEAGVVGFVSAGPAREDERPIDLNSDGEIYALYVLSEHQRQGVGGQLLSAVFDTLRAHGFQSAFLWVLEANPARGFYEAMGGLTAARRDVRIGEAELTERAYTWRLLG